MFVYYNANPMGTIEPDCVVRAISTALGIEYYKVLEMLYNNSNYFNCDMLVKDCYKKIFDDYGLIEFKPKTKKSVREVAEDFNDDILIIRIEGHLTTSLYGNIYDVWDCSDEIVDTFWIVN